MACQSFRIREFAELNHDAIDRSVLKDCGLSHRVGLSPVLIIPRIQAGHACTSAKNVSGNLRNVDFLDE